MWEKVKSSENPNVKKLSLWERKKNIEQYQINDVKDFIMIDLHNGQKKTENKKNKYAELA